MTRSGGCLCGAVRFTVTGEPINVMMCHCTQCQKAMGGPAFARALYPMTAIRVEGETAAWATSEHLERVFCPKCGTRIMAARTSGERAGIALSLFDDPADWRIDGHMFVAESLPWFVVGDDAPRHEGRP